MAPRTRSNRIETLARQRLLASGQTLNTSGFASLPDELYLEIISHFPAYPIPCGDKSVDIRAVRDRHLTLFALSQTCRSLRPAFLRYLWQRIEVYNGMETRRGELRRRYAAGAPENKKYAEELVRQLEVVTVREPSLARHVKSVKLREISLLCSTLNFLNLILVSYSFVNVIVTEYSVDTVLAELARCIALFPNLHTVQLNFRINKAHRLVEDTFKAYKYPSIKNIFVCPVSVNFLYACPKARFLAPMFWRKPFWWPQSIFDKALNECPTLEVLGPFYLGKGQIKCKPYPLFSSPANSSDSDLFFSRGDKATQST